MRKFKVLWDNGHACDALPWMFDTEEDANNAGKDWLLDMAAAEPEPRKWDGSEESEDNPGYSFEVIEVEVEPEPSEEELEEANQMDTLRKAALNRGQP